MRYRQLIYRLGLLTVLLLSGLGWFWPSGARPTVAQTNGSRQLVPAATESQSPAATPKLTRATSVSRSVAPASTVAPRQPKVTKAKTEQITPQTTDQPTTAVPTSGQATESAHATDRPAAPRQTATIIQVVMSIAGVSHHLAVPIQASVLDAMQQLADAGQIQFQTERSSLGVLVTAINKQPNGTDGRYWFYSVNGAFATVGVAAYSLHDGDRVDWEYKPA